MRICVYTCIYTCTCIHTHTHTYIHTYIHTAASLSESMILNLQDSIDEVADELVTAMLALRNMVKLARMTDCEDDKIYEYKSLLEVCMQYVLVCVCMYMSN